MSSRSVSTRTLTRQSGQYTRQTPGSRSLERGLALLRAFRPGTSVLANAELAERTGLPRSTVSRLTRSLVESGFLAYDLQDRAYRLTPVFLSLARAFQNDAPALEVALPLMKSIAEGEKINVGIAVRDRHEMVYLSSVRESRDGIFRRIQSGTRTSIERTALGRAYLAGLDAHDRMAVMNDIALRHGQAWTALRKDIENAMADIARLGYCVTEWPGMVSVAASVMAPDRVVYAVNISFACTDGEYTGQVQRYAPMLLELTQRILLEWKAKTVESAKVE